MRVLAFGDSLTAGYYQSGAKFAPWAPLLAKLLDLGTIDHIGMSGFTTGEMVECLDSEAVTDCVPRTWPGLRHKLNSSALRYDAVLILGGTNDLADKVSTGTLVENLASLHRVAHEHGAKTVAMTIPESHAALRVPWLGRAREEANAAVRSWAAAQPPQRVRLVEAATIVPFSEDQQPRLWEPDGLHMSAKGYEAFGRGLARMLVDYLRAEPSTHTPSGGVGASDVQTAGTAVRIDGLKGAPQHNGKTGRLAGRAGREGRVGVVLDDGHVLSVRRENVILL